MMLTRQQMDAMTDAVEAGDPARVKALIAEAPTLVNTYVGKDHDAGGELWMPLHRAALHGHADVVRLLLDHGAHPDCRTRFETPDRARATALHHAAARGHAPVAALLLDRGAQIDLRDFESATPLHRAAFHGRPATATVLVRRGAELEARDDRRRTPLHLSIWGGPRQSKGKDQDAVAALLIEAGADVNAENPDDMNRYTPLHACVHEGPHRLATAGRLLAAGADAAAVDPESKLTAAGVAAAFVRLGHAEHRAYVDLLSR